LDIELVGDNLTIIADRNALQVLFTNVLGNSKKYTPEGGKIRITIKSPVNNQQVCVCIEDSGPGIPESDYDRVFDRFYRVTNDRSDQRVPGTGLGLSIAKHVLDLHGGAITLSKSTTLGGLCVAISLVQEQDGERVSVKTYAKD
jgi:signal transduction histidine kinase